MVLIHVMWIGLNIKNDPKARSCVCAVVCMYVCYVIYVCMCNACLVDLGVALMCLKLGLYYIFRLGVFK